VGLGVTLQRRLRPEPPRTHTADVRRIDAGSRMCYSTVDNERTLALGFVTALVAYEPVAVMHDRDVLGQLTRQVERLVTQPVNHVQYSLDPTHEMNNIWQISRLANLMQDPKKFS